MDTTSLVAKLNRDLNLSSFVSSMRRAWRVPFMTAASPSQSPPTTPLAV
jgi:hypothetical protein